METQTTRAEIVNTADEIAMALGAMSGRMRRRAEYMGIADQTMRTFGFTPGCVNEGELFANILPGRFFGAARNQWVVTYRYYCANTILVKKMLRFLSACPIFSLWPGSPARTRSQPNEPRNLRLARFASGRAT